ncbi:GNAT family N-acetyltransferase [Kordiimonas sediminis]|uniref:GNAT family N-acetyltransferase n=1 Tax=Kordiimonas sediminis TaxID=1735581 RepID=A0A919EA08_9PROT|nr:bifunctional helix-turn-helix transcriptional regulator/GNAT family N-acetyltransferase [Kordiimonas sediminis]GHF28884.1 GNAT family N-acetyltransferase [Kordiimonas sediminis]
MSVDTESDIQVLRHFSRFYTHKVGLLKRKLYGTEYSLSEARVIYELANNTHLTASDIASTLDVDPAYISRMVGRFEKTGLLTRIKCAEDARRTLLHLTDKGTSLAEYLADLAGREMEILLKPLGSEERLELRQAFQKIEKLLSPKAATKAPLIIRQHRSGDLGWVVERHATLYRAEFGYGESFEALVTQIAADFLTDHDKSCERCWIAEHDGKRVGSIMLVREDERTSRIRILLVDPTARGLGAGRHLVQEAIHFARDCGYSKIVLWTTSEQTAAIKLYESFGFAVATDEPSKEFGGDVRNITYQMEL